MSLDIFGWGKVAELAKGILDKVITDPQAKLDAQIKLAELEQLGEFKQIDAQLALMKAQTDINLADAQSSNPWQSGWRPAIGWICALGLLYQFLLRPLMPWVLTVLGFPTEAPMALDGTLQELVYALLGLGLLRSVDKAIPLIKGK